MGSRYGEKEEKKREKEREKAGCSRACRGEGEEEALSSFIYSTLRPPLPPPSFLRLRRIALIYALNYDASSNEGTGEKRGLPLESKVELELAICISDANR